MNLRCVFRLALIMGVLCASAMGDVVLDWNATIRSVMQADVLAADPGWSTRSMAMMNGAMYDSFQAVNRTHEPYHVNTLAPGASRDAAAAQAAYEILSSVYPNPSHQTNILIPALNASLMQIPDGPAKTAGVSLGSTIAQQYINWRTGDGADVMVPYEPVNPPIPGHWQPDPLHPTQVAWGPGWGAVTPFALNSSNQFPVPGVPALNSQAYTDAYNQVKEKGALNGSTRTPDETAMGLFWAYDRATMGPPPVLFSRNVTEISQQLNTSTEDNARLFAMTSVAMADAAIASWDIKFIDDFWRPVTAIRAGDTDGNSDTVQDAAWIPLGAPGPDPNDWQDNFTPPFPAYTSGHATMGGANFEILREFYGVDNVSFTLTSQEMPAGNDTRSFTSFSQAEQENAMSRIFLGVHWIFDATDGTTLGNDIAGWVVDNHFQPIPEPSSLAMLGVLCLGSYRLMRRHRNLA